jgi:uncharacterized membrane protein
MTVSPKRHLAKTISYRILSTGIGFVTMWLVTDSIKIGAAFSIIELVWKPIQYYIHERVWYKHIKFGLVNIKESVNPPVRIMESMPTDTEGILQPPTVTTTVPKRLVYTKKTE